MLSVSGSECIDAGLGEQALRIEVIACCAVTIDGRCSKQAGIRTADFLL